MKESRTSGSNLDYTYALFDRLRIDIFAIFDGRLRIRVSLSPVCEGLNIEMV